MAEEGSHTEQGQIERAQRIRRQIERLKSGRPQEERSEGPKSLREQVEERTAKTDKPADSQ